MVKRIGQFTFALCAGWVLGWLSVLAVAAWYAWRELDT